MGAEYAAVSARGSRTEQIGGDVVNPDGTAGDANGKAP